MIRLILYFALFLSLVDPSFADDPSFEEAMALFSDGKYTDAKPIADAFAAKDDPRAFAMLGTMSQKGLGVEVDPQTARLWFGKAAAKGHLESEVSLALMLMDGTLGTPNIADGIAWLEKAAAGDSVQAQYNLGLVNSGVFNTKPDWKIAASWFQKAANKGLAEAQYNLALLFVDGRGVEKDMVQAANWFAKSDRKSVV